MVCMRMRMRRGLSGLILNYSRDWAEGKIADRQGDWMPCSIRSSSRDKAIQQDDRAKTRTLSPVLCSPVLTK